jgi:hypothetical protein
MGWCWPCADTVQDIIPRVAIQITATANELRLISALVPVLGWHNFDLDAAVRSEMGEDL